MTRFQLSLIAVAIASGLWFAQLATSFSVVRWGCICVLLGYFVFIGIDALIDKAKAEGSDYYGGNVFTVITPHIGAAIALLFVIFVGIYVGW